MIIDAMKISTRITDYTVAENDKVGPFRHYKFSIVSWWILNEKSKDDCR